MLFFSSSGKIGNAGKEWYSSVFVALRNSPQLIVFFSIDSNLLMCWIEFLVTEIKSKIKICFLHDLKHLQKYVKKKLNTYIKISIFIDKNYFCYVSYPVSAFFQIRSWFDPPSRCWWLRSHFQSQFPFAHPEQECCCSLSQALLLCWFGLLFRLLLLVFRFALGIRHLLFSAQWKRSLLCWFGMFSAQWKRFLLCWLCLLLCGLFGQTVDWFQNL